MQKGDFLILKRHQFIMSPEEFQSFADNYTHKDFNRISFQEEASLYSDYFRLRFERLANGY